MKKFTFTVLLFIGLGLLSARAQQTEVTRHATDTHQDNPDKKLTVSGGVKLEANYSNFLHSGITGGESSLQPGITSGGFINLGIMKNFSIQGELLFHYKESDFEWSNTEHGQFQYWGMEVPIYVMYHWQMEKGQRIHLGVGPYTEFGLSAKFKKGGTRNDLYERASQEDLPAIKDSNTGFGVMAGYEFAFGLQVNISYKVSVSNLLDANSGTARFHPQAFSLGVAYRFGR